MYPRQPLDDRQTKLADTLKTGSLADIITEVRSSLYWMWADEAAYTLMEIHSRFGAGGPETVVLHDVLKELKDLLKGTGIAYVWTDTLAREAGTIEDPPVTPTLRDAALYLSGYHTLHGSAVRMYQAADIDSGDIYVEVDTAIIPASLVPTLMRVLQESVPQEIKLLPMPSAAPAGSEFAAFIPAYDLVLRPSWSSTLTTPWSAVIREAPVGVKQEDGSVGVNPTLVQKSSDVEGAEEERYVLNYVLIPNNPDTQDHLISKEEVRKACHWWAENAGNSSFALHHVMQGGEQAPEGAIVMLENFLLPTEVTYGDVTLPEGTWMLGARINDDEIWGRVQSGEFNAWSIGAMTYLEPAEPTDEAEEADA